MMVISRSATWLPGLGAAGALALAIAMSSSHASAADRNAHDEAMSALGDLRAAVQELDQSASLTKTGAAPYKETAQRAINALVGKNASDYVQEAGNPGDEAGAIGRLQWLQDQAGSKAWQPAVQTALVNATAAKARLHKALGADELDEFRSGASAALETLLVALGRGSDTGALGALQGALSTTDLGVPAGEKTVSGCAPPSEAPAFGVTKGYLTFIAVPRGEGANRLPEAISVKDVRVTNDLVVLHTAATDKMGELCPGAKSAEPTSQSQSSGADPAHLYTQIQAEQGRQIFEQKCVSCHGEQLQGKSAPPIGGSDYLNKAKMLGWSAADLRQIVVTTMPRDNPGSLSPEQYAQVLAYLLAYDCYPAGQKKFPTQVTPELKNTNSGCADQGANPEQGTCPLQTSSPKTSHQGSSQ